MLIKTEENLINRIYTPEPAQNANPSSLLYFENNNNNQQNQIHHPTIISEDNEDYNDVEDIEIEEARPESLSLQNNEKDLIIKALEKLTVIC